MLRTALRPRWLGLLLLVLVIDAGFVQLGRWQLGVARHVGDPVAAVTAEAAEPLTEVMAPHDGFPSGGSNKPVTMTGSYEAQGQVLVAPRRLNGVGGLWVITPLRVERTGAVIAVLRAFVLSPEDAPDPPAGQIHVSGTLAPGESPATSPDQGSAQVLGSVDLSVLVNRWGPPAYDAFVFATAEEVATSVPGSTGAAGSAVSLPDGAQRVPPPTKPRPLEWRNAAYALQWWLFAAFAVWMWWKMVRNATSGAGASVGR
ncbi:MAG: SURF1 family protein, partial [Nostocoides sp.]